MIAFAFIALFQTQPLNTGETQRELLACVHAEARRMEPSGESASDIADAAFAACETERFRLALALRTDEITFAGRGYEERRMSEITTIIRQAAVREIVEMRAGN